MKKIFALFVPLLALIGCTLSIEDELPQPEEIGFDEPVTVENEYGSLTYQFNDSVLYVTERVQEHITMIDDSTLFYDGSTPKEWRPYVGSKLAAGVSHLIPGGLNNRVVSVTQQDGGYLVQTQRTTIEDVYKSLSYDFDFDNDFPYASVDDSDELLDSLGYTRLNDSTLIYWGMYDEQRAKALGIKQKRTRASGELEDKEDEGLVWDITFDTRNVDKMIKGKHSGDKIWTTVAEYLKQSLVEMNKEKAKYSLKGDIYAAFNLQIQNHVKSHFKRIEETEYEESWNDSYYNIDLGIEVGLSHSFGSGKDNAKEIGQHVNGILDSKVGAGYNYEQICDILKKRDMMQTYASHHGSRIKLPSTKIVFAVFVNPFPCDLYFSAEVGMDLSLQGMIAVNGTIKSETKRNGYRIMHGKETKIENEPIEESSVEFKNLSVNGSFKAAVTGRTSVGFEAAGSIGVNLGANIELGVKGDISATHIIGDNSSLENFWKYDGNIMAYGHLYADIHFTVAPLGFTLADVPLFVSPRIPIFEASYKFSPTFPYVFAYYRPNYKSDEALIRANYKISSLGMSLFGFSTRTVYPQMRLYFGDYREESTDYVKMTLTDENYENECTPKTANSTDSYYFKWNGNLPEGCTYCTLVPYIDTNLATNNEAILCPDYKQVVEAGIPTVSINEECTKQTYGGENLDFTGEVNSYIDQNADGSGYGASVDPSTLRLYRFATLASVRNGSYLQKWGIKVEVFTPDGKRSVRKKIPMNPNKTGFYTLICSFYTNWQKLVSGDPVPMQFRVTPYWVDSQGVSHEGKASAKMPIEYECVDITPETTLGFVVEKDL